jgi:hypothetical protein
LSSASAGGDARAILCAGIIVLDEVFRVDRFPQPDAKTQAQFFHRQWRLRRPMKRAPVRRFCRK